MAFAATNQISPFYGYTVYIKLNWEDPWVGQPYLICESLVRGVLPRIDQATLRWNVGRIKQTDAQFFEEYYHFFLMGYYVKIEIPGEVRSGYPIIWVGQVVEEGSVRYGDKPDPTILSAGGKLLELEDQHFTALHISWLLSRNQIDSSFVYAADRNQTELPPRELQRAFGYNNGLGDGRTADFSNRWNRDFRPYTVNQTPVFAQISSYGAAWNGYQILQNVLKYHSSKDGAGDAAPLAFVIDSSAEPYLHHEPTIRTEGRSALDVINSVLDPRRGLVSWFEYNPETDTVVTLFVSSGFPDDITLPSDRIFPKSLVISDYDFDNASNVRHASATTDGRTKYDRVKVRGAMRTSTFTVSVRDDNLIPSWSDAQEEAYRKAADSDNDITNDRVRKQIRFERVYQAFRIPDWWPGWASGLENAPMGYVNPKLTPGSVVVGDKEPFNVYGLRLARETPLKAGWDYTKAQAPSSGLLPLQSEPEFLKSFAVAKHGEKYIFLDKASGHVDEDGYESNTLAASYSMRPLFGEPGIEISPNTGLPHSLAENHFSANLAHGNARPSSTEPEIDYFNILFTICVEFDSYCEGVWPNTAVAASPLAELVVYIGDKVRLDWLAEGTVIDINDDGSPKTCETGGPVQDDRVICEDIAKIAYEWYSLERSKLSIEFNVLSEAIPIGALIRRIGTVGTKTEKTVNASVTRIVHNLHKGTTHMTASYAELDLRNFA